MSEKMDRLQFYLPPSLNKRLDEIAKQQNVSKAFLIREGVENLLKDKYSYCHDPAYSLIGLIDEGIKDEDAAKNHNHYLYKQEEKHDCCQE